MFTDTMIDNCFSVFTEVNFYQKRLRVKKRSSRARHATNEILANAEKYIKFSVCSECIYEHASSEKVNTFDKCLVCDKSSSTNKFNCVIDFSYARWINTNASYKAYVCDECIKQKIKKWLKYDINKHGIMYNLPIKEYHTPKHDNLNLVYFNEEQFAASQEDE
ncbi:MAG: hypothetical protein KDH96_07045 [Candidatus Riesia sp.]|nr:hypothetical protein [Candidatus Riesia sp.]